MQRTQLQVGLLLGSELTHGFGRTSNDHAAIRKLFALGHERSSAHDAAFADLRAIEHNSANTDQGAIADGAAMQHDFVSDRHVIAYDQRLANIGVQHAAILDIGAPSDANGLGVSAYNNAKPDAGVFTKLYMAHDLGAVGNPGGAGYAGNQIVKLIDGHGGVNLLKT